MGIVIFDWKPTTTSKRVENALLASVCLFDGYLTEPKTYPHFGVAAYLTEQSATATEKVINYLFSNICLFDGYLTEPPFFTPIGSFRL